MTTQHELFPLDGNETEAQRTMEISTIHVKRMEGGKFVYAPTSYSADALETIQQLFQIFGGGDYVLEARDADRRFCRTRRLQLPGPPKPLSGEPPPAPVAPVAATAPAAMSEGMMMVAMMERMVAAQSARDDRQNQLLIALLTKGEQSTAALADRRAELEREARRESQEFLKMMLEQARGSGSAVDEGGFIKGIEFAQGLFSEMMEKQAQQSENPDDFLQSLTAFMQGLGQIAKTTHVSTPTNGTATDAG